jgi:tetratricopeptide (TPR) repeat protein
LLKSIPSLDSDEHENADRRARLTAWLAGLYRGRSLLNPLRPDRLGEALVRSGFIARYGAEGLQRVLAATTLAQTARALTVLTRSSSQSIAAFDAIARTLARCHSELVSRLPEPTAPRRELDGDTSYAEVLGQLLTGPVGLKAQSLLSTDELEECARSLHRAGVAASARHDYASAQRLHQAEVTIYAQMIPPLPDAVDEVLAAAASHDPRWNELASARDHLARAHEPAGDLGTAIPLLEQTLNDRERVLGPDHPDTLTSRNNLAFAYESAGNLAHGTPLFEQTLTDRERVLGPDHPDTLTSRNDLAYAYRAAGDLGRAMPLFEQTLIDRERVLAPDHPDALASRNNLAGAYRAAGDLGRAIPLFEHTLNDRERILGPDHPDTLTSRNNLAYAYRASGDLGRAIRLYEQTLTDAERVLGPDHPQTLTSQNNLGGAYRAAGDLGHPVVRADPHRQRAGPRTRPPPDVDVAEQPRLRLPGS